MSNPINRQIVLIATDYRWNKYLVDEIQEIKFHLRTEYEYKIWNKRIAKHWFVWLKRQKVKPEELEEYKSKLKQTFII